MVVLNLDNLRTIGLTQPFDQSHQVMDWRSTNEIRPDITTGHRMSSRRMLQREVISEYDGPNYEVIDVNNLER